jgi:hypothetical protein
MTTAQWISMVVLIVWPVLFHLASPIGQMLVSKLPGKQQEVLKEFATIAVQQVEQVSLNTSNAAKKQLAMSLTIRLFKAFHIPLPAEDILDAAIESVVYMLPSKNPPPPPIGS